MRPRLSIRSPQGGRQDRTLSTRLVAVTSRLFTAGMVGAMAALLAACATAPQLTTSGTSKTVPTEAALAMPPLGGPAMVEVVERQYSNATQQDIALSTSSNISGQNVLRVQFFGPVDHRLAGQSTLSDRSLATTNIYSELRSRFPGVSMRRSPYYVQNRYGPFGYAVGRASGGDTCLYAWQRIRPTGQTTLVSNKGTISLRLRMCDATMTEDQLLSVMYGITINAYFRDLTWNPYGAPPPPAEGLGQPGAAMLPRAAGEFSSVLPPVEQPPARPRNIRQARTPTPAPPAAQPAAQPVGPRVPPPPSAAVSGDELDPSARSGPSGIVPSPPCLTRNGVAQCN